MRPETGENLGGYDLKERLQRLEGRSTWLARGEETRVIVKTFSLADTEDWKAAELFDRSIEALSELDLEAVPDLIDSFEVQERNLRVLVREYISGESLAERLECGWHPGEDGVRNFARKCLEILEELHDRNPPIIHRDIKPGNIIISESGRLSLIDFGVVRTVLHREETHPGTVVGTYGYMAPEQFRGHAEPTTDLYGLGATMIRIVTGRDPADLPYDELRLRFREHCSIDSTLADWLDRMIAPQPDDRFESARTAREALDADAVADTAEHAPLSDVEIADTAPDRSDKQQQLKESAPNDYSMSPDVTASHLLDQAPSGCRIEGHARRHCLEFVIPADGLFQSPGGMLAGLGLMGGLAGFGGFLVTLVRGFSLPALIGVLATFALCAAIVDRYEHGQLVQIGDGFLRVQYRLFGQTYGSAVRTDIEHVEIANGSRLSQHGKRLRIWAGTDDYVDLGHRLSPPELNWFQSLLTFCLDRPELMRRTEVLRKKLDG